MISQIQFEYIIKRISIYITNICEIYDKLNRIALQQFEYIINWKIIDIIDIIWIYHN